MALIGQNVSVGVVGKGLDFTIYDDTGVEPFLSGLEAEERRGGRPLPPEVEEDLKVPSFCFIVDSFFVGSSLYRVRNQNVDRVDVPFSSERHEESEYPKTLSPHIVISGPN